MAQTVREIVDQCKAEQQAFNTAPDPDAIKRIIAIYQKLLMDAPDDPEVMFQLGTAFLQLQEYGAAMPYFDRVTDFWPDNPHVWSNYGCCERALHRIERARACFVKSLMAEERAETLSNLASTYINEDAPEIGIPYAERALECDKDGNPRIQWNYSLLLLELGDYAKGFKFYDAGFFCQERAMRNYTNETPDTTPWWGKSAEAFINGSVVLWDEQGIGDRILAANLLRNMQDQPVILECHPRLEGIYRRSFPWIEHVYPTSKSDHIDWPDKHEIQSKQAIMSLSQFFWQSTDAMDRTPYLVPDPELVDKYRAEFAKLGAPPYYAFSWKGGALKTNTGYRSLKLGAYRDMISAVGGTWISMQYHDEAPGKVDRFRAQTDLPVYHCAAAQERDYDHTLAALAAVDQTVTVCNSIVHTCGAAGLPVYVMVPRRRAWRYPRGDSFPWYGDAARMFHQEKDNDWSDVIESVTGQLIEDRDSRTRSVAARA